MILFHIMVESRAERNILGWATDGKSLGIWNFF